MQSQEAHNDKMMIFALRDQNDQLREQNKELVEALDKATTTLWAALGGNDDPDCRQRADYACKPYRAILAKARP